MFPYQVFHLFTGFHFPSLAAARAGKSTLFKQAISLYGEKPTHAELMSMVPIINSNIVQNIKTLVRWSDELRNPACPIAAENAGHRAKVDELKNDATKLPPDYMRAIAALWLDAGIQARVWDGQMDRKYQP